LPDPCAWTHIVTARLVPHGFPRENGVKERRPHERCCILAQLGTGRSMAQALQADTLTKRVRDGRDRRTVVADVSLSVDRGELCILRGPSCSGKTTLLAMLGAMLTPTSGEVRLDGIPTSRLRDAHRAFVRRRKVG